MINRSVELAMAFCLDPPEGACGPTNEDCDRFIAWQGKGTPLGPLATPGVLRLVRGFKNMGLAMVGVTDASGWAYGFEHGYLFLSDFDDSSSIVRMAAWACYERVFGAIPKCARPDWE